MYKTLNALLVVLILAVSASSFAASKQVASNQGRIGPSEYLTRPDSLAFIDEMVKKHKFQRAHLMEMFRRVNKLDRLFEIMNRPAEAKPWHDYRPIFVTDKRAKLGVTFWQENAHILKRAEKKYGVPAEIIVAIIGVETRYGGYTGRDPVLDVLTSFAFDYPKRAKFFRKELEQFLLLTREEGIDPHKPMGSYAGAMGMPQFISSSYRMYAVDFDNDGVRDLWESNEDVIGSVANYFSRHGWRKGAEVILPVPAKSHLKAEQLNTRLKPAFSRKQLSRAGIAASLTSQLDKNEKVSLIALQQADGMEYVLGRHNFYVITRYNHSPLYAMAVYQLSQRIKTFRDSALAASN
ncbi:MAG: lytic murein transglycosylase B [Gammaproteobacteria bacterium]|nr:lytic murein transglycosylase B [Gammaproteobacteria bacterium]